MVECGFQATNEAQIRWCTNRFSLVQRPKVVQTFTNQGFQRLWLRIKRLERLYSLRFKAI